MEGTEYPHDTRKHNNLRHTTLIKILLDQFGLPLVPTSSRQTFLTESYVDLNHIQTQAQKRKTESPLWRVTHHRSKYTKAPSPCWQRAQYLAVHGSQHKWPPFNEVLRESKNRRSLRLRRIRFIPPPISPGSRKYKESWRSNLTR